MLKKENLIEYLIILLPIISFVSLLCYRNVMADQLVLVFEFIVMLFMALMRFQCMKKTILLVLVFNIISIAGTLLFHSGIGVGLNLLCVIMACLLFNNVVLHESEYKIMHGITAFLLSVYVFTLDKTYVYGGDVYDFFGNDLNVNTWGMLTLAAALHWSCFIDCLKRKKQKKKEKNLLTFLEIIVIVAFGYQIYLSESRTSLIVLCLFVIWNLAKKKPLQYKNYKKTAVFILLASVIFPFFYLYLYGIVSDITVLGKGLFTGRQIVWGSVIQEIMKYPFLGSGNDLLISTIQHSFTQSSHNMLLGVMKAFGIIPTVTIIFFLVNRADRGIPVCAKKTAQIALLTSLLCAFFESFIMDSHLYMFFVLFLLNNIKMEKGAATFEETVKQETIH